MSDFWKFIIASVAGGAISYLVSKALNQENTPTSRFVAVERRR